jgi:hypothetical protein
MPGHTAQLPSRRVQFEGEDSGVGLEIGVGGKDGPIAGEGDGANQDVGDGYADSSGAAFVAYSVMMRSAHSTKPTKIAGLPNFAPH